MYALALQNTVCIYIFIIGLRIDPKFAPDHWLDVLITNCIPIIVYRSILVVCACLYIYGYVCI